MVTIDRNQQLQNLADSFGLVQKAMALKYGQSHARTTPVLSKVVRIIGSEKRVNIKRLASLLFVSSGAVTQHVAALEEAGTVKRLVSTQDRREIIVELTPQGQELYREIRVKTLAVLSEVFADLDDDELDNFIQLMAKISSKYQLQGA